MTAATVTPQPGQVWDVYHDGSQGLGCGHRIFVLATMNAERVTLLETYELARVDMPADAFATYRRKSLQAIPARRIAKRILDGLKEGRPMADPEVADLALSALGWKPEQMERTDMTLLDISAAAGRFDYANAHTARRAAGRILANPGAREGVDFELKPIEGRKVELVLKDGNKGKTEKMAKGATGIERQMAKVSASARRFGKPIKPARNPSGSKGEPKPLAETLKVKDVTKAININDAAALADHPAAKANAASWPSGPKKRTLSEQQKRTGAAGKPATAPKPKKVGKAPAKAKKAPAARVKRVAGPKPPKGESKVGIVAALLQKPEGTTTAEILKATGWPSVSVPQQAKSAKLTLRKEKVKGEPTRYYGAAA